MFSRSSTCLRTGTRQMLIGSIVLVAMLGGPAFAQNLLVFAAASTKPALDKVFASVDGIAPDDVKVSYAASSQLARQIEAGAPAAVFVSADEGWMNYLDARKLIVAGTRADLLGNALVLIASSASHVKLDLVPGVDLAATLGADGHLALAEPNSVPAGKYAKAALTKLGIWDRVTRHRLSLGCAFGTERAHRRDVSCGYACTDRVSGCDCRRTRFAGCAAIARCVAFAGCSNHFS